MATIKLEDLVKTYGDVEVLHNLNGNIEDGEFDKSKLASILAFIKNENFKQNRDVIGDKSVNEKWIWLEEE
mgnify:CR=1 FL=1